jgi:hypothetical protein
MQEHILDTLGVRDKVFDALADAIRECTKEGAKEVGKEYAKELAVSVAGKAISPLTKELAQALGGELAKTVAGAFVGPLVGILFRVVDDTKARINKVLSEPEITAVREARRFLDLQSDSPADTVLIGEKFAAVSDAFDRTYTFAQGERDARARMLWIRMMQGLIARHRDGVSVARLYFQECFVLLRDDYTELAEQRQEIAERLARCQRALDHEIKHPPPKATIFRHSAGPMNAIGREALMEMNLQIASGDEDRRRENQHRERIEKLNRNLNSERESASRRLNQIQKIENFINIVRELGTESSL